PAIPAAGVTGRRWCGTTWADRATVRLRRSVMGRGPGQVVPRGRRYPATPESGTHAGRLGPVGPSPRLGPLDVVRGQTVVPAHSRWAVVVTAGVTSRPCRT